VLLITSRIGMDSRFLVKGPEIPMQSNAQPRTWVYMIGNAHIDPVWLWPLSEGRNEVLATYRTAIALIQENDRYVFTSGGSVTYRWVEEDDPTLFEQIRTAVAQGKWALVNGWWLQPDCNIPDGEAFARHALYGQRYLQERLGRRARVGYNVDSFGHAATLPQLLKLSGLDYYVFFRPGPQEKDLPQGPFWWEAPGGARVLACRPPLHYCSPDDTDIATRIAAAVADTPADLPLVMCFYGVGNHGGGPTRRNVSEVAALENAELPYRPLFASPEAYFAAVEKLGCDWPVIHDDLQHHSRGCYTALSRVKRENRQAEQALMSAERLASFATLLGGAPNAQGRLTVGWQAVLLNQFHDILAGTSLRTAYDDVWQGYATAQDTAAHVQNQAVQALSAHIAIPDRGAQRPVLIWNSLPWERAEVARVSLPLGEWRYDFKGQRYPGQPIVEDAQGKRLPCQIADVELDYNTYIAHLDVKVAVPALGARLIYVALPETEPPTAELIAPPVDTIANGVLRLRIDPETGWLISLYDLERDVEMLSGPANVPLVIEDPSDTWSHDVVAFRDVCGQFKADGPARLIHDGPARKTVRITSVWGRSRITQDVTLYPGVRAVDVTMTVDWHEQLKMLKLAFPLNLSQARATASAPYGWIARATNGEEEPCQAWLDLSGVGPSGPQGLCLLNDSKYGYDALDNELRLSILRSPIYAFHRPREIYPGVTYHYTDQGEQIVRYRLLPHAGAWEAANPVRTSLALHTPLIAQPIAPQKGDWQADRSLLRVEPEHVVATTIKLAEHDGRLIVRGYETEGRPARLTITSEQLQRKWSYDVGPHEIWTLSLSLDGDEITPLNLLEDPLL